MNPTIGQKIYVRYAGGFIEYVGEYKGECSILGHMIVAMNGQPIVFTEWRASSADTWKQVV